MLSFCFFEFSVDARAGICHRTESDLFLFSLHIENDRYQSVMCIDIF